MVKKSEVKREESVEKKDVFRVWADSYASVSRMWEDSYVNLYKPWIESTGEMFEKAVALSKEATPEKILIGAEETNNLFKSWTTEIEENTHKTQELLAGTPDPEKYRDFDDFFENMPMTDPMKKMMEPVKSAARIYKDTFVNMANMWMKSGAASTSRA